MKLLSKKIYIVIFVLSVFLMESNLHAKENKIKYKRENISHYFQGIIYANLDDNDKAFEHLKRIKTLEHKHHNFNIEYIRGLFLNAAKILEMLFSLF